MEIAALTYNDKLNYNSALQIYSLYEYIKNSGEQIQIIDYNLYDTNCKNYFEKNKNRLLYNFLNNNVMLTSTRYKSIEEVENLPPLADKYLITNAKYEDLDPCTDRKECYAYGIKDISKAQLEHIKCNYKALSTIFDFNEEEIKEVADPIFLLSKDEWIDFSEKSKIELKYSEYIIIYANTVTKDMLEYTNNLIKDTSFKVYIVADKVCSLIHRAKRIRNVNPSDLVKLLANAQHVITSAEDGIKLGIIFEKNLHIFYNNDSEEQVEIINKYNLYDRVIDFPDKVINTQMNYMDTLKTLQKLKENSIKFLKLKTEP